jgi:hypothetical protein
LPNSAYPLAAKGMIERRDEMMRFIDVLRRELVQANLDRKNVMTTPPGRELRAQHRVESRGLVMSAF